MIWDLNIRIFHVLLIILTILTIASIKLNIFFLHQYFGVTFIGLIVFRIYWGFYGSFYSRFKNFYYSPGEIILFIKGYKIYKVGHNPLGSLSIFSFYFVITILTISGLFSSDDIIFDGPLASMDQNLTKTFTKIHNFFHYIIYILIALHIIAILYYQIVKKQKLINQMIDGISRDKKIKNNHLSKESSIFGFFILLFCLIVPSLILFFITF